MMASYLFLKSMQDAKDNDSSTVKANITREITMVKHCNGSKTKNNNQKNNEEILRKRKERFGEISPPRSKRISKQVAHILTPQSTINILKKRKERFGESVSSLLKEIEEKEKILNRQVRFCNKNAISDEAKQVKLRTVKSEPQFASSIEVFQTIDQIEEERKKRDWLY